MEWLLDDACNFARIFTSILAGGNGPRVNVAGPDPIIMLKGSI
jgi:hypothetical protein